MIILSGYWSFFKVNYLRAKLSKCVELGLISASVSREQVERTYEECPNLLDIPGKTVNEIKTENELLQMHNLELKEEIEELLRKHHKEQEQLQLKKIAAVDVDDVAERPRLHSSMYHENEIEADSIDDELDILGENTVKGYLGENTVKGYSLSEKGNEV